MGTEVSRQGHKGPGELLSDLDFLPTALGHLGEGAGEGGGVEGEQ